MAKLAPNSFVSTDPTVNFEDYSMDGLCKADAYMEKLQAEMLLKDPDDPHCDITGTILQFPAGDGAAYYIVSKQKPLTLQHMPYSDAWHASGVTIKGVDRQYILDWLRAEKRSAGARGTRQRGWAPGN